jgi:hypothetical protein
MLGLEVGVIRPHAMKNIQKLLSRHPIAAMEYIRILHQIGWVEIVFHNACMSTDSISVFFGLALHRRPTPALWQKIMAVHILAAANKISVSP